MDDQEYMITCPRCGSEFKSTSRYCMKYGYLNPNHPGNETYFDKYSRNDMEEYTVSGYTKDVISQPKGFKRGTINIFLSGDIGSFNLCFAINILCYLLCVAGIVYFYYDSSPNLYMMMGTELSYVLLLFSFFSLFMYAIQLLYMKMNKRWIYALIPLVNLYVFSDAITKKKLMNLLVFIPVVGEIYLFYLLYQMGKAFKKSGLITMLFPIVMIPIIAFGGSGFHDICYVSEKDSLEKEYGKKKFYGISCAIVVVAGLGMIVYSNAVNINHEVDHINSYYLYYATKKTVRRVEIKLDSNLDRCTYTSDTKYFYFSDLYDFTFLPFYVFREPIEAYIKVVETPGEDGNSHREIYVSMTDGKYGYPETKYEDISFSTIVEYPVLDEVYENENRCEFRKNA